MRQLINCRLGGYRLCGAQRSGAFDLSVSGSWTRRECPPYRSMPTGGAPWRSRCAARISPCALLIARIRRHNDRKMDVKTTQNVSKIADFTCRILILRAARTFRFGLRQPLPQGCDLFLQAFDALAGGDECDLGSEGRGGRGRQLLLVVSWRRVWSQQR